MASLGAIFSIISVGTAFLSVAAALYGIYRNSEQARLLSRQVVYLHFLLLLGSVLILAGLLVQPDMSVWYVANHVNHSLPGFYKLTAIWAGQAGSILIWSFLLALFSAIAVRDMSRRQPGLVPYMIAILGSISFFFAITGNFSVDSDPFMVFKAGEQVIYAPEGRGLNPLLQHWAMIIHPPILFFGYVSFAIPFAIAMGALWKGEINLNWTRLIRRWSLFSWFFLGTGMLLGGKWAYEELGWGGYWAWDPVENASLMPWLTATAFLHSIIVQEKRGMFKVWNMVLVSLSFFMCIFGTYLTRSQLVVSVHSFAQSDMEIFFEMFLLVIAVFSFGLIFYRLKLLKSDRPFNSFLSREAGFLFNNVILVLALVTVTWGTLYPWLSHKFLGQSVTLSANWFNKWMGPLGLLILFLTGMGPLLSWRKTRTDTLIKNLRYPTLVFFIVAAAYLFFRHEIVETWSDEKMKYLAGLTFALSAFVMTGVLEEFIRATFNRIQYTRENFFAGFILMMFQNKRRYLGYMVHIGLAILFIGFAGKAFSNEGKINLRPGESERFGEYLFELREVEQVTMPEDAQQKQTMPLYVATRGHVAVYKNNKLVTVLKSEKRNYPLYDLSTGRYDMEGQVTSEPGIYSLFSEDIYIQYAGDDGSRHVIQIWINPLVIWVWLGFGFFTLATIILLLPVGENKAFRLFGKKWYVNPQAYQRS